MIGFFAKQQGRDGCGRPRRIVLGVLFAIAFWPASVRGKEAVVAIRYLTRVSQGVQPRIEITSREVIDRLEVKLLRADGVPVDKTFSSLAQGVPVKVSLPGDVGAHRWTGTLVIHQGGVAQTNSLAFEVSVADPLRVTVDRASVDIEQRFFVLHVSRPVKEIQLSFFDMAGHTLNHHKLGDGAPMGPGSVKVTWPAMKGEIARIDVKAIDEGDYFAGVSLMPWTVYIPHDEVNFTTDSAKIEKDQLAKLQSSFDLITGTAQRAQGLGQVGLYIAGHTDTQGKAPYNLGLSLRRARAIATHFRQKGLRIPIFYEGFGEHALKVATADETDEVRNRRVDYILAIEPPQLKPTAFVPRWHALK